MITRGTLVTTVWRDRFLTPFYDGLIVTRSRSLVNTLTTIGTRNRPGGPPLIGGLPLIGTRNRPGGPPLIGNYHYEE